MINFTLPEVYSSFYIPEIWQYEASLCCLQFISLIFSYGFWEERQFLQYCAQHKQNGQYVLMNSKPADQTEYLLDANEDRSWEVGAMYFFSFNFQMSSLLWWRCENTAEFGCYQWAGRKEVFCAWQDVLWNRSQRAKEKSEDDKRDRICLL